MSFLVLIYLFMSYLLQICETFTNTRLNWWMTLWVMPIWMNMIVTCLLNQFFWTPLALYSCVLELLLTVSWLISMYITVNNIFVFLFTFFSFALIFCCWLFFSSGTSAIITTKSVNYKFDKMAFPFALYLRRQGKDNLIFVDDTTTVSPLTVLLFLPNNLRAEVCLCH